MALGACQGMPAADGVSMIPHLITSYPPRLGRFDLSPEQYRRTVRDLRELGRTWQMVALDHNVSVSTMRRAYARARDRQDEMTEHYELVVRTDEDGIWHVTVPDLPGIHASGATEQEMQDNLIHELSGRRDDGGQCP